MPVEAATNCWTSAESLVGAALAELERFQEFVREADAAAAAGKIFVDEKGQPLDGEAYSPDELETLAAYALVSSTGQQPYKLKRAGVTGDLLAASGRLQLFFEELVHDDEQENAETTKRQTDRRLKNLVGDILADLVDYCDIHGGPWIREIEVSDGPLHTAEDARPTVGHWQGCEVIVVWGRED